MIARPPRAEREALRPSRVFSWSLEFGGSSEVAAAKAIAERAYHDDFAKTTARARALSGSNELGAARHFLTRNSTRRLVCRAVVGSSARGQYSANPRVSRRLAGTP